MGQKTSKTKLDQKDFTEARKKAQVAALLVVRLKISSSQAARLTGLSKTTFIRYQDEGLPDGPIWLDNNGPSPEIEGRYNQIAETQKQEAMVHGLRDSQGRFQPGRGPTGNGPSLKARADLEKFTPEVAKKLIRVFKSLPDDEAALILAYAKEIFDRALGKPRQSVDISGGSHQTWEEYGWLEEIIQSGDVKSLELAASLASSMASYARNDGKPLVTRQVEIIPPPEPIVPAASSSSDGQVPEADNQSSSTKW